MSGIKKSAKHGNFIIEQAENDTVSIICDNTRQALRDIASEIGMEYDPDWNTRYFGHRLINFINGVDTTRKSKEVEEAIEDEELTESLSDEDWEWWCGLSNSMKYTLLWNLEGEFFDNEEHLIPKFDDLDDEILTEMNLYDRDGLIGFLLKEYITGIHFSDGSFENGLTDEYEVPNNVYDISEIHKLSYIKQLTSLSFRDWGGGFGEKAIDSIIQITQLQKLNLSGNSVEVEALFKLDSLPNLQELYLEDTNLDSEALAELKVKLPNCTIFSDS